MYINIYTYELNILYIYIKYFFSTAHLCTYWAALIYGFCLRKVKYKVSCKLLSPNMTKVFCLSNEHLVSFNISLRILGVGFSNQTSHLSSSASPFRSHHSTFILLHLFISLTFTTAEFSLGSSTLNLPGCSSSFVRYIHYLSSAHVHDSATCSSASCL